MLGGFFMSVMTERARVAALSRSRTTNDPDLIAAKQRLKAAGLYEYVQRTIASAPPLSDAQKSRVAALLNPVAGGTR